MGERVVTTTTTKQGTAMQNQPSQRRRWPLVLGASLATLVVILALVVLFFPWDRLREPVNR